MLLPKLISLFVGTYLFVCRSFGHFAMVSMLVLCCCCSACLLVCCFSFCLILSLSYYHSIIYPSIHSSINPSIYLSIYLSICICSIFPCFYCSTHSFNVSIRPSHFLHLSLPIPMATSRRTPESDHMEPHGEALDTYQTRDGEVPLQPVPKVGGKIKQGAQMEL